MIEAGWNVVVTHGNGPQVGFILRRSETGDRRGAPVPMDYAVADTQGAIGYMFLKALSQRVSSAAAWTQAGGRGHADARRSQRSRRSRIRPSRSARYMDEATREASSPPSRAGP